MPILVVCPGCRKTFKVSDKFAGKSGPCPNCKRTLEVPAAGQDVQVHAPAEFAGGGRTTAGKLALKPVSFTSAKFDPVVATIVVATVLVVLALTWIFGRTPLFQSTIVLSIGLLVVSPPLVVGGYLVLHDDEFEPYRGKELYVRSSLCAVAYAVLWGMFAVLYWGGLISGEIWLWFFLAPPFWAAGAAFALAALDLDFTDGLLHYSFYILVTVLLHRAAGLKWVWDMAT